MNVNNVFKYTVLVSVFVSSFAFSKDGSPKVFGTINAGVQKIVNESDIDGQAFETALGVKGVHKENGIKLSYKLEAEFTDATNASTGEDDLHVKNAIIAIPTSYGTFVMAARGESGAQRDMYGAIDIFENNEANSSTGLWAQGYESSSVMAYSSPKWNNIKLVVATLTLNQTGTSSNYNNNTVDSFSTRAVYKKDGVMFGISNSRVSKDQVSSGVTYNRSSITASYDFDNTHLGFTREMNKDHPSGSDFDTTGVVIDMSFDDAWSAGIGYTSKDSDNDASDNSVKMLIVRNQLMKNAFAFAEVANYDESNDNYSFGINLSF